MSKISSIYRSTQFLRPAYHSLTERHQTKRPLMVFTEARQRYEVYDAYTIRVKLKEFGFWFDGGQKCWYTQSLDVALKAGKYASRDVKRIFGKLRRRP